MQQLKFAQEEFRQNSAQLSISSIATHLRILLLKRGFKTGVVLGAASL
ncbi:hypothetical protein [Ferrimicrobium sp.]|nr:hypothetical protein [Ferrimicrobium sp.]